MSTGVYRLSLTAFFMAGFTLAGYSQRTDSLLQQVFSGVSNPVFRQVVDDPQTYRLQIIYTQVNRDGNNKPVFTNYYFNYDPLLYFNPASTVKLPLALLSLEKLNTIHKKKVNKYTTILFDSSYERQTPLYTDSSSENGLPSIAHFIKKAFLVSDNDAYNRMYQFVGQQTVISNLHDKGYTNTRIIRQFRGFTPLQNRHTNPVRFVGRKGRLLYLQPAGYNTDSIMLPAEIRIGTAHYNSSDSLVNEPFNFTPHNNIPLLDLQQMLQSLMEPGSVPERQRFNISAADRRFLLKYLSQYPSETSYPKYDTAEYYDSYVKFFFRNGHNIPKNIRVFNKVGWSYGFVTDVSYVVDFATKVEFMLSATLYVNRDGILNDNKYEYKEIGYPFLYQLGQAIYNYELKRPKATSPKLSAFRVHYDKRKEDGRANIKETDN